MSFYEVKYKTATQFCIVQFWGFLAFFLWDFLELLCAILFPLSDIKWQKSWQPQIKYATDRRTDAEQC